MAFEGQTNQSRLHPGVGMGVFYKLMPGGTRQIVDFQLPGDFLGLRSVLFRTADHNIEPFTKVEASEVLASDLLSTFSRTPRLATAVLWAASRDEAMVVEHLVGIGRRDALERTAHFSWSWAPGSSWSGLARRTDTPAHCPSTCWRTRWASAPST